MDLLSHEDTLSALECHALGYARSLQTQNDKDGVLASKVLMRLPTHHLITSEQPNINQDSNDMAALMKVL